MPAIPTPWDKEIKRLETTPNALVWVDADSLTTLRAKAEGYRRAKTEDADLVDVLREALESLEHHRRVDQTWEDLKVIGRLQAALAKYQGKEV